MLFSSDDEIVVSTFGPQRKRATPSNGPENIYSVPHFNAQSWVVVPIVAQELRGRRGDALLHTNTAAVLLSLEMLYLFMVMTLHPNGVSGAHISSSSVLFSPLCFLLNVKTPSGHLPSSLASVFCAFAPLFFLPVTYGRCEALHVSEVGLKLGRKATNSYCFILDCISRRDNLGRCK